jgi:hypothetical protein
MLDYLEAGLGIPTAVAAFGGSAESLVQVKSSGFRTVVFDSLACVPGWISVYSMSDLSSLGPSFTSLRTVDSELSRSVIFPEGGVLSVSDSCLLKPTPKVVLTEWLLVPASDLVAQYHDKLCSSNGMDLAEITRLQLVELALEDCADWSDAVEVLWNDGSLSC